MSSVGNVGSFRGKVLLSVAYRHFHLFNGLIPKDIMKCELAFEAINFGFGHSDIYVIHRSEGLSIESTFEESNECQKSYWVSRTRFDNWKRLRGIRIASAKFISNATTCSQQLLLEFDDGTKVRISPTISPDEENKLWPPKSRLIRTSFSYPRHRKKSGHG